MTMRYVHVEGTDPSCQHGPTHTCWIMGGVAIRMCRPRKTRGDDFVKSLPPNDCSPLDVFSFAIHPRLRFIIIIIIIGAPSYHAHNSSPSLCMCASFSLSPVTTRSKMYL